MKKIFFEKESLQKKVVANSRARKLGIVIGKSVGVCVGLWAALWFADKAFSFLAVIFFSIVIKLMGF